MKRPDTRCLTFHSNGGLSGTRTPDLGLRVPCSTNYNNSSEITPIVKVPSCAKRWIISKHVSSIPVLFQTRAGVDDGDSKLHDLQSHNLAF